MSERPRYLGRVVGYVDHASAGMCGEPEALTEDEQQQVTEAAARRALDERLRRRQATSEEVMRELRHLEARATYLRRQLRRLARPA